MKKSKEGSNPFSLCSLPYPNDNYLHRPTLLSTAEVASSQTKTGGFFKTAIARYKLITI
ncbi:hypothetical protein [Nostoc sp.]|uniref:hypothetical protein n=1 Tax=Nostoc sp. TaxID=1180 RepID=UPI002FFC965A